MDFCIRLAVEARFLGDAVQVLKIFEAGRQPTCASVTSHPLPMPGTSFALY